jgi:hypothetical protein
MHGTLDITGAVTVGVVFHRVTAALVDKMAVGAVPDSEGGIDVSPEGVVIHAITGLARGPFFRMNQDERSEFGQNGEDEEIDQYESKNGPKLLENGFRFRSFDSIR